MKRRFLELFLARRISERRSNKSDNSGKQVIVNIATISVTVGVAVMIISLSVIGGFRESIVDRLTGFLSHIKVENMQSSNLANPLPITINHLFEDEIKSLDNFRSITPVATKNGIVKSKKAMEGIELKGMSTDYDSLFFKKLLIEGNLPIIGNEIRRKDILISQSLANLLEVGIGDKIEIIFTGKSTPLRRDAYKICGIYHSGMADFDKTVTLTDIRNVQRLNGWQESQISRYEIMCNDFSYLEAFRGEVQLSALYNSNSENKEILRTTDLISQNPYIFDWLATHNVNAMVIIVIMLIVALLSMISALLIIVLDRTQMVGVLKAMGMRNRSIQNVFLIRSLSIVGRGLLWGNIVGIGLSVIQKLTGAIKLDSDAYLLSEVPISFDWQWIVGLNLGIPVVLTLLLMIPVAIISTIKPEQSIRYQ